MTDPVKEPARRVTAAGHSGWWWALVPVAVLAGVGATPFGGWVQSFFYGTGEHALAAQTKREWRSIKKFASTTITKRCFDANLCQQSPVCA